MADGESRAYLRLGASREEHAKMSRSESELEDDRLIRELLQNWVVWRDAGDWERFRNVCIPTAA